MQRLFLALAILFLVLAVLWPWLGKLPLGRLPGDILIERDGFRFYFPLTSMLIISAVLTLLLWLFRR